jgi:tyrosyl-tRNA synthetase
VKLDGLLSRSVDEIIIRENLEKKLKSNQKLKIKLGADPTKPDLHLGHAVVLRILKKFQEAGHSIIFVVGDYTVRIGDPSGRSKTRPMLTEQEIEENSKTYFDQVGKILDLKQVELKRNSEWCEKLTLAELIKLTSKFTIARILERDDFSTRYKKGVSIGLHEFLYPVLQAYDSLVLKADIEIGGTDQKFNMLAGRELQEKVGEKPQDVIICQILEGIAGKEKMSKSLNNYIGIMDEPLEMFGKIMSIPDELIIKYYTLCTDYPDERIKEMKEKIKKDDLNPRDAKAELAFAIVKMYHDEKKAQKASEEFDRVFKMKEMPEVIHEIDLKLPLYLLPDLLVSTNLVGSKSEAKRLIEQGGVKIDGDVIRDKNKKIKIKDGMVLQVGKRKFVKINRE